MSPKIQESERCTNVVQLQRVKCQFFKSSKRFGSADQLYSSPFNVISLYLGLDPDDEVSHWYTSTHMILHVCVKVSRTTILCS